MLYLSAALARGVNLLLDSVKITLLDGEVGRAPGGDLERGGLPSRSGGALCSEAWGRCIQASSWLWALRRWRISEVGRRCWRSACSKEIHRLPSCSLLRHRETY